MNASAYLFAIILGAIAGALANWLADTLPNRTVPNRIVPGSHRRPLLGLTTIVGFVITLRLQGALTVDTVILWIYLTFLLIILVIDYEHRRVLNCMLGPAAIFALFVSLRYGVDGLLSAALGGTVGFGLFLLLAIIGRGKLGAGDVKLAGVIGLMTGYPAVLVALVCGVLLGGIAALFLLITRRATRKSYMAYAPYLALGALSAFWLPKLVLALQASAQ